MMIDTDDIVSTVDDWRKWLHAVVEGERTEKPSREDLICLFANLVRAACPEEYGD